jgi:hypothetical protein
VCCVGGGRSEIGHGGSASLECDEQTVNRKNESWEPTRLELRGRAGDYVKTGREPVVATEDSLEDAVEAGERRGSLSGCEPRRQALHQSYGEVESTASSGTRQV